MEIEEDWGNPMNERTEIQCTLCEQSRQIYDNRKQSALLTFKDISRKSMKVNEKTYGDP